MSTRYECLSAVDTDIDLILPGDEYGADVMPDGHAGLAIGEADTWTVIAGTPTALRELAARITTAVNALEA